MSELLGNTRLSRRQTLTLLTHATGLFVLSGCGRPRVSPFTSDGPVRPGGTNGDAGTTGGNAPLVGQAQPIKGRFDRSTPVVAPPALESDTYSGTHVRVENGIVFIDTSPFWNDTCQPPQQLPQDLARAIVKYFGTGIESAEAATVAWSENTIFDQYAVNNNGQTQDYGYFQINSANFPGLAAKLGLSSIDELFDVENNVASARILYDESGGDWYPWFGPGRVQCLVRRIP